MKTRELLLETSTSVKCSDTCLCCFAGAKESTEDHAVILHESWRNNKILWLTGWAKSTTDPTLSKSIHFQTVFLPTFFCNLKNLSFPVSKMLRSILNPFSHSFLVEFRVEGKTLLKQFNQFLKNLKKMLNSAQMCLHYKPRAGSLHSTGLLKIQRCKIASSIFHWEKNQQSCSIFSRAIFTPSQTPSSCARCAFHHRKNEWRGWQSSWLCKMLAYMGTSPAKRTSTQAWGGENGQSRKSHLSLITTQSYSGLCCWQPS